MSLVNDHLKMRAALIQEERSRSHHHRSAPTSAKQEEAIKIINRLREAEMTSVWNEDGAVYHSMPFTSARETIKGTKLFGLIQQMPKGCLLHCHMDAMASPDHLVQLALSHSNLLISSSTALLPSSLSSAQVVFTTLPHTAAIFSTPVDASPSITSSDYIPNTFIPADRVRASFPGGTTAFDQLIVDKLTCNPQSRNWSKEDVWAQFQSTFNTSAGLFHYEPVFEEYIAQVFRDCADDGVPYLEPRINFLPEFMVSKATGLLDLPHREWLLSFDRAVTKVKNERIGSVKPFIGARIIYSTVRFVANGEDVGEVNEAEGKFHSIRWFMRDCIELKKEFPHLICGFDLVGFEDGLKPLIYYIDDLTWFKQEVIRESVDIPYLFHAGETLTDGGAADQNLYDAILLDTKRIGHGFSLPQHPLLMEICKSRQIAVECCPISNELLRYTASTMSHPLSILLNYNVPVSLSCDDPQFFGNPGLSYDFYQVFTASDTLDIIGLGDLARKSFGFSMMEDEETATEIAKFDIQFDQFLDLVIASSL